jgi:hypothetical protein
MIKASKIGPHQRGQAVLAEREKNRAVSENTVDALGKEENC